jgi:hypothetical protein
MLETNCNIFLGSTNIHLFLATPLYLTCERSWSSIFTLRTESRKFGHRGSHWNHIQNLPKLLLLGTSIKAHHENMLFGTKYEFMTEVMKVAKELSFLYHKAVIVDICNFTERT